MLLSSCGAFSDEFAKLTWPPPDDGSGAGIQQNDVEPNRPFSFDDMAVCIDKPGTVTVDKVTIANPHGGIKLRAFSVRKPRLDGRQWNYISSPRTTLADAGFPSTGPFTVSTVCTAKKGTPVTLLAVELERPDNDQVAYGTGFVASYTSDGHHGTAFLPFGISLCPGNRLPECEAAAEVRPPD